MKIATHSMLKNQTGLLLRRVMAGESVIVTFRGKPTAALLPLQDDQVEDFLIEHNPRLRALIREAEIDISRGRIKPVPRSAK